MRKYISVLMFLSLLVFPACPKRQAVVIPDSKEIKEIPGEPGWFKISGGHLRELYEQQRILVEELEKCQNK